MGLENKAHCKRRDSQGEIKPWIFGLKSSLLIEPFTVTSLRARWQGLVLPCCNTGKLRTVQVDFCCQCPSVISEPARVRSSALLLKGSGGGPPFSLLWGEHNSASLGLASPLPPPTSVGGAVYLSVLKCRQSQYTRECMRDEQQNADLVPGASTPTYLPVPATMPPSLSPKHSRKDSETTHTLSLWLSWPFLRAFLHTSRFKTKQP